MVNGYVLFSIEYFTATRILYARFAIRQENNIALIDFIIENVKICSKFDSINDTFLRRQFDGNFLPSNHLQYDIMFKNVMSSALSNFIFDIIGFSFFIFLCFNLI
jgi:hypothetical protein